ncbi:unnamed protein product [Phaeothamnion confervicola]
MGGAASILRRRRGEVVSPTKEKEEAKAEANKPNQEDDAKSLEEIICRLMQVHHAQSKGDRWEKVTKKVNQYLKRRRIPTQSIKDAIRREGVELPTCWQLEEIKERERKLAEALHGKQVRFSQRLPSCVLKCSRQTSTTWGWLLRQMSTSY